MEEELLDDELELEELLWLDELLLLLLLELLLDDELDELDDDELDELDDDELDDEELLLELLLELLELQDAQCHLTSIYMFICTSTP